MTQLNDTFVKNLTPPVKEVFFYDDAQPGFALKATPSGGKYWYYVANVYGKTIKRKLDDTRNLTTQAARGLCREVAGEFRQGTDRFKEARERAVAEREAALKSLAFETEPRIDVVIEDYLSKRKIKQSTKDFYQELADNQLKPYLNLRLRDMTPDKVVSMYEEMEAASTPLRASQAIKFIKSLCLANDKNDPIPSRLKLHKPKARRARLEPRDGIKVWEAINRITDKHRRAFMGLLLLTGCRTIEIAQLKHKHIDLVAGNFVIPDPKNGQDHIVYLSEQAEALLRSVMINGHPENPVFGRHHEARDAFDFSDFPEFSNHDMRKCFAITCIELGIHDYIMKACLNHKTADVTYTHYAQATPSQKRKAWTDVANYYGAI